MVAAPTHADQRHAHRIGGVAPSLSPALGRLRNDHDSGAVKVAQGFGAVGGRFYCCAKQEPSMGLAVSERANVCTTTVTVTDCSVPAGTSTSFAPT